MTSRLDVVLMGAEVHRDSAGTEVGTATFVKTGDRGQAFTVDATPAKAMQLMKSPGNKFAIVIETVTAPPSSGAWAHRLLSFAATLEVTGGK